MVGTMKPVISIGNQDFRSIRESKAFYIDKTAFIKEWWENQDVVTLIIRPRRFGKTLNMSMTEYFFSNQYAGQNRLFEGLSIWNEEIYRDMQGTYPVIFISLADVKGNTYHALRMGIIHKLVKLYSTFEYLKSNDVLTEKDVTYFNSVNADMDDDIAVLAINYMSDFLNRYYGEKVLIFIDEYDTPLLEAYLNGCWDEMTAFIRSLFNSTLKTNPYLERALLTGITRISKESIFSDLNNPEVVTSTSHKYETAFGFTEEEVAAALSEFELSKHMEKVKHWYDGFCFGSKSDIYNPWSITKFLDSGKVAGYWANTSSNGLIAKLIQEGTPEIKIAVEDLLAGKEITASIDEELVFEQLGSSDDAIWSLLLASGYLKITHVLNEENEDDTQYSLSLTNLEIKKEFRKMIQRWFKNPSARYNDFIKALFLEDIDYMNQYMNQMSDAVFSYFDTGNHTGEKAEPERLPTGKASTTSLEGPNSSACFYHGFVLGLIADSNINYWITSNRESGLGRYDVVMEPKNPADNAYVLEFKVHKPGKEASLEDTVKAALNQITDKNYDAALIARGIPKDRIRHYGFAFDGKKVLIGCP